MHTTTHCLVLQVETLSFKMKLDAGSALSELRKKSGTVAYLQNLRNKGTDQQKNTELCPICRSTMEDRVSFTNLALFFVLFLNLFLLFRCIDINTHLSLFF